jgi:hypothetical protein
VSLILELLMNSEAQELQLIREQAEGLADQAVLANVGPLVMLGTPSNQGIVDAVNQMLDPQGIVGTPASGWEATIVGDTLAAVEPPAEYVNENTYRLGDRVSYNGRAYTLRKEATPGTGTMGLLPSTNPLFWEPGGPVERPPVGFQRFMRLTSGGEGGLHAIEASTSNLAERVSLARAPKHVGGLVGHATRHKKAVAEDVFVYVLVNADVPATCGVKYGSGPLKEATAVPPDGWHLLRFQIGPQFGKRVRVVLEANPLARGAQLRMTGVTVCLAHDPGEPFSGDTPDYQKDPSSPAFARRNYAYSWEGPRGFSYSLRHERAFDMLRLFEEQAEIDVSPLELMVAQRRAFLQARFKARHRPYEETFIALLVFLLEQELPGVGLQAVRVVNNYSDYSMEVQITFPASGKMEARVERLIEEIKPAHIAVELSVPPSGGGFRVSTDKPTPEEIEAEDFGILDTTPL